MSSQSIPVNAEDVRMALRGVIDPELGDNLVDLGMIRDVQITGASVTVTVALTISGCPLRTQLKNDVVTRVSSLSGVDSVKVEMGEMTKDEKAALMSRARWKARETAPQTQIPPNTRVIAVSSGKGGVGKSSVTANLAVALAARGLTVGVLDADIAGFSIPRLLGVSDRLSAIKGQIEPELLQVKDGLLKIVSMGLIEGSGEEEAVMLRGLMLNRALQHFLEDVNWGDMDYMLIDMPPGTGDIQMGLARMLPRADMLVVTTPSLAAQQVAARAIDMARRGYLRVAGVIENMSYFENENGQKMALFGEGGGQRLATSSGVPLIAQIPIDAAFAEASEAGTPLALNVDSPTGVAFSQLADQIVSEIIPLVEMSGCTSRLLDAVAHAFDDK